MPRNKEDWARRLESPLLFLHLGALALAIGPALFFGAIVAPAAFRLLPTRDLAASLTSPVLSGACVLAEVAFGVLFVTSWLLTRDGVPPLTRSLLTRLPVAGFFAALVIRELLIPPIDKIRAEAPGLIDNLPAADPSRLLLDRYHRLATGLFGAMLVVAFAVLVLTTRLLAVRRAQAPPPSASRPPVPKLLDLS
jgi:hypothetical protein